jgi:uncharacterized secreted protein with C-terminal beta-propeller domain
MSVGNHGARIGAAAFALGISLSGPQVASAHADPTAEDSPAVSSESASPDTGSTSTRAPRIGKDSTAQVAPRRGLPAPDTALTDPVPAIEEMVDDEALTENPETAEPDVPEPEASAPVRQSRNVGRTATALFPESESAPPVAVSGAEAPQTPDTPAGSAFSDVTSPDPDPPTAAPAPAAAVATLDAVPVQTPAALRSLPQPATSAADAVVLPAPVPATAVTAVATAVTGFFDSAANWLSSLPASPVTQFLEGALLLVRRAVFEAFPSLNAGQTTGQNGDQDSGQNPVDPAYFTDEELRAYLLGLAEQQYGHLFGQTVPVYGYGWGPYPLYLRSDAALSGSGPSHSDTNTQVNGVDEADFVETDGRYIYTARGGQLTIVDTGDLSVASQAQLSGYAVGQYLSGDRLTVVTQTGSGWYGPMVRPAPGYHWGPWTPQTTVTVYDITDRAAPVVVTQTTFDGDYQSSRSVDGVVYLVLGRSVNLPAPAYTETVRPPKGDPIYLYDGPAVNSTQLDAPTLSAKIMPPYPGGGPTVYRTYETWDQYVARVGYSIVEDSLPHVYSVDAEGNLTDLGVLAGAEDIVRPQSGDQSSLVTVVTVDSAAAEGNSSFSDSVATMVSGWGSAVYMNQGALYVATSQGRDTGSGWTTDTHIDRFTASGTELEWGGSGTVSGTLINQFAMDEKDGYLRVATQTNDSSIVDGVWRNEQSSGVYVFDTAGGTLTQVGSLTGLAPGEHLYAVRYEGDTAYLVTFLQTDPLFVIDMSDPQNPILLGELVIPGFSNYLQSVGDGLLLGIGQEREPGTWNTHLIASLFDITDPSTPIQIDRDFLDADSQWSSSEAQFDHHALLYSAEDGLLVVPVSASGHVPGSGYRHEQYLKVMRVGPDGIAVVGEIHPPESAVRTIRIGEVLYVVGETSVTAYRISDLSEIGSTAPSRAALV